MHWYDVVALVGVLIGLVGVLIPLLPGSLLIAISLVFWGIASATSTSWVGVALALAVLGLGLLAKYLVTGRRLQIVGLPNRSLLIGAVAAIVGFFVIPIVGLAVGFVVGIYLAEAQRIGFDAARGSTWEALKAIGLAVLIELTAGFMATAIFVGAWIAR